MSALTTFLRGLRILRHPELVRRLGELLSAEREIEQIRAANPGARFHSTAWVEGLERGTLRLGNGAQVERGTVIALGDDRNGYGILEVGERTWIGPYNNLRLSGGTRIVIGADCLISQFCTLVSANHALSRRTKMRDAPSGGGATNITIGDDVWLGANCVILPGTVIADGAVIGAGSVVKGAIGAYEIWAGNPAHKIGERPE